LFIKVYNKQNHAQQTFMNACKIIYVST
jgi:hypothetical protein